VRDFKQSKALIYNNILSILAIQTDYVLDLFHSKNGMESGLGAENKRGVLAKVLCKTFLDS
jgi:hypothetical protein